MKRGNHTLFIVEIIVAVVIIFSVIFFVNYKSPEIRRLADIEVKDYNGEDLSSIMDFMENSIKGPQHINISNYKLEVTGLVDNPKSYTYDEVIKKKNYEKVVTLNCVEGWDVKILWKGILVKDLIEEAKPKSNATTVIFYAYDGYSTAFPLDYIKDNNIILAYEMNNVTLPAERGFPFHLVAESKWGYKWIKWVTKIELSDDENYKGYWESRGYAKEGNLNESFVA
ncbi:MAG: molybdopterin-dependent oxidoreductase [Candidatus Pacearchaeota archaeon]